MTETKPALIVIAGPIGAGKTTFYNAHLREAFPTLIPPIPHRREATLHEQSSFAVEDFVVEPNYWRAQGQRATLRKWSSSPRKTPI